MGESIKAIKKSWEYVTALDERLLQEMKGISSMAGVDETAIIYLNLGFLVYSSGSTLYEWFLKDKGTVGSSSNVCFTTSIDVTVLAMNKDGGPLSQNLNYIFPAGMQDMFIHLSWATDGISTMGYTAHVGKLSGYGMNEAGFCLAGTATRGTANIIENIKDKEYGINSWLMQRLLLLNCKDVLSALSPNHYLEFGVPYNARLGEAFGGLVVHSCGPISHNLKAIQKIDCLTGICCSGNQNKADDLLSLVSNTVTLHLANWDCIGWGLERKLALIKENSDRFSKRGKVLTTILADNWNEAYEIARFCRSNLSSNGREVILYVIAEYVLIEVFRFKKRKK